MRFAIRFAIGLRERAAQITGVPPENIEKAARWIGETDRAMGIHARGHRAPFEGCRELPRDDQSIPRNRQLRP